MEAKNLVVYTGNPAQLLKNIKNAIDKNTVRTWRYDGEGDFTHTAPQWDGKGWLRPEVVSGALVMRFMKNEGQQEMAEVRGVCLGRFAEMLVNHFRGEVTSVAIP